MSRAVIKAYDAYPLNESNRFNHEWNAKRLGYKQGYEQAEKDTIERACEWLGSLDDGDRIVDVKALVSAFRNEMEE